MFLQQCSDAIKRAQVLKEKMNLPKSLAMPAAPGQQPSAAQTPMQMPSSTALHQGQDSSVQGSLQRQGSLPSQQPAAGKALSKAISMPNGASNTLRAYAAGAVQTGSPNLEGMAASPDSPQRSVLGRWAAVEIPSFSMNLQCMLAIVWTK